MSIDKSVLDVESAQKSIIRSDRDRFFEAVDYQKDILKYLKQLEVNSSSSISGIFEITFSSTDSEEPTSACWIHEKTAWY